MTEKENIDFGDTIFTAIWFEKVGGAEQPISVKWKGQLPRVNDTIVLDGEYTVTDIYWDIEEETVSIYVSPRAKSRR